MYVPVPVLLDAVAPRPWTRAPSPATAAVDDNACAAVPAWPTAVVTAWLSIWLAVRPPSRLALRLVTIADAFVVNGTAFEFTAPVDPTWNEPTVLPELAWNENASPFCRFTARTQDSDPGALRQP